MKHSIHNQFTTSIYQSPALKPHSPLFLDLLSDAEKIFQGDYEGFLWSKKAYKNGYTSYGSLDQLHYMTASFKALAKILDTHLARYIKDLKFQANPKDFYLSRLWLNVMPKNCYHAWHIHPLSVISGTFYLQLPQSKAPIRFEDPRLGFFMNRPTVKAKKTEDPHFFVLNPHQGDVVLFESWLKHEVPMHGDSEPRISISFNYDWNRETSS
jgi:uncharacterized protein (TIGR02466 family)